ncbi:MAG: AbrB/MazE/SpoVT family DNA-binding domain-containing protein [Cyanosarcina radialis HA8281-LM2]|jgi:AbrB family looped-hinge helix DNA binding protein|nr:AbrB/MazE/SpoVT family DNA-binding domain-containing protein [Cyanosarcina radialis HA8281-LM2]
MEVTRLSKKGKVIIPKALRIARNWEAGQELIAIDVGDGILLKPKNPLPETTLSQVTECLKTGEKSKNLDELEDEICRGSMEQCDDRSRSK